MKELTVLAVVLMALVMWYGLLVSANAQGYYVDQYSAELQAQQAQQLQQTQAAILRLQQEQQLHQQQMDINRQFTGNGNGNGVMIGVPNGY